MPDGIQGPGIVGPAKIDLPKLNTSDEAGKSFKDVFFEQIQEVNQMQQDATNAAANLATGDAGNVNDVMMAVQKADLAFKMLMQIRNKLMDAYQEINQLRI